MPPAFALGIFAGLPQPKDAEEQAQRTKDQAERRNQPEDGTIVGNQRLGVLRGDKLPDDPFFFILLVLVFVVVFIVPPSRVSRSPSMRSLLFLIVESSSARRTL